MRFLQKTHPYSGHFLVVLFQPLLKILGCLKAQSLHPESISENPPADGFRFENGTWHLFPLLYSFDIEEAFAFFKPNIKFLKEILLPEQHRNR